MTLEVAVKLSDSMLDSEQAILSSLNEAGSLATGEAFNRFDTDGSRLEIGGEKWFSKGEVAKIYQTSYGEVEIAQHMYQSSTGGKTFCPLERDARIVVTSTPRFAKLISHKFANSSSIQVQRDLRDNHAQKVARSYLQRLADTVGSVAQAKEQSWHDATPKMDRRAETVGSGIDGTCLLLCEEGYRGAMIGTLSLYDGHGECLHTIYRGATRRSKEKIRYSLLMDKKWRLFFLFSWHNRMTPRWPSSLTWEWSVGQISTTDSYSY